MDLIFKTKYKLEVKDSKLNGVGLFTNEPIPKHSTIFTFGGSLLDKKRRYDSHILRSTCIGINDDIILCANIETGKDETDFINHSCSPNIGLKDAITVLAINNIDIGTELVIDYRFWEFRENWELKDNCNCGSENCNGLVNSSFYKTIDSDYKYFEYFTPSLKNKIKNKL